MEKFNFGVKTVRDIDVRCKTCNEPASAMRTPPNADVNSPAYIVVMCFGCRSAEFVTNDEYQRMTKQALQ